jgi:DNA-binding beta-propeller fold protein YncE
LEPIGRIGTGAKGPHWFVISPDGNVGYASNKEAAYVSVVDLRTGTMTAMVEVPGSEGPAVSGDGGEVFAAGVRSPGRPGRRPRDGAAAAGDRRHGLRTGLGRRDPPRWSWPATRPGRWNLRGGGIDSLRNTRRGPRRGRQ